VNAVSTLRLGPAPISPTSTPPGDLATAATPACPRATTQAEALPPDILAELVRTAIEANRDPVIHHQTLAREEAERHVIRDQLSQ
jgi:hypothetical protein